MNELLGIKTARCDSKKTRATKIILCSKVKRHKVHLLLVFHGCKLKTARGIAVMALLQRPIFCIACLSTKRL